jgi:hypothetical protein
LQKICDGLSAAKIDALLRKWLRLLLHPFTAPLGAENRGVLLGFADENDPLLAGKPTQMLGHQLRLCAAPCRTERAEFHARPQRLPASPQSGASSDSSRLPTAAAGRVLPEEPDNPLFVLEIRHIDVEIHPIDSLNCELSHDG